MVVQLNIQHNIDEVRRYVRSNRTDQLPFATALALTRTAQRTQAHLASRLPQVFDRPTPYTLNSLYVRPATKTRLVSSVYIKDEAPKGTPAERYLRPEIEGGQRNLKRMELALQSAGLMPVGWRAVPGAQAPLDAYGNVPASFIVRMLSDLQALGEQGYTANRRRARKGARRDNYFFVPPKGSKLKPGVYWHMPGRLVGVVFVFVRAANYQPRFDFYGEGQRYADQAFKQEFLSAWQQALATAR